MHCTLFTLKAKYLIAAPSISLHYQVNYEIYLCTILNELSSTEEISSLFEFIIVFPFGRREVFFVLISTPCMLVIMVQHQSRILIK